MSKKTKFIDAKRRGFMQGSVVAGGVVATGVADAAIDSTIDTVEPVTTKDHAGYKLTDKVKRYYDKARF